MSFKAVSYSSSYSNVNGVKDYKEKKMYDDGRRLKVYKKHNGRSEEKEFVEAEREKYLYKKYSLQKKKIKKLQSREEKMSDIIPRTIFDKEFFYPENIVKNMLKEFNLINIKGFR